MYRAQTARAIFPASILCLAWVACDTYSEPIIAFPQIGFKDADGKITPLTGCPSPSQDGSFLTADGTDLGILEITNQNGGNVLPDKYQISLASTDGRLTFALPNAVGDAAVLQSTSTVALSVSVPGQVDEVLVRAGTQSGDAHIAVTANSRTEMFCLRTSASQPSGLSVQIAASSGAPTSWTAYQLTVALVAAVDTQVSDSVAVTWSATGCALLASDTTNVLGTGSAQNTIYLPPGWTESEVIVTAPPSLIRNLCLTPGGGVGANVSDGKCPAVSAPNVVDAGSQLTVACPATP